MHVSHLQLDIKLHSTLAKRTAVAAPRGCRTAACIIIASWRSAPQQCTAMLP